MEGSVHGGIMDEREQIVLGALLHDLEDYLDEDNNFIANEIKKRGIELYRRS